MTTATAIAIAIGALTAFGSWWALIILAPLGSDTEAVTIAAAIAAVCLGAAAGLVVGT